MSNNLISQISKEIEKTGFPLELRISSLLRNRKYLVEHSNSYLDKDTGKGREVDLIAHRFVAKEFQGLRYYLDHFFVIECKKSDKPWVVFTAPAIGDELNVFVLDDFEGIEGTDQWTSDKTIQIMDQLLNIHPLFNQERRGRSFFIPFAGFEANETIFKALTTSFKASIAIQENPSYVGHRMCFYYPMVVFQGKLFEAYLDNDEIQVAETESIMLDFSYRSENYKPASFVIPIITDKAFSKYVTSLEVLFDFWEKLLIDEPELFDFSKEIVSRQDKI